MNGNIWYINNQNQVKSRDDQNRNILNIKPLSLTKDYAFTLKFYKLKQWKNDTVATPLNREKPSHNFSQQIQNEKKQKLYQSKAMSVHNSP